MTDDIGYGALTQSALLGIVREALKVAARPEGLPGDHHFYIAFRTKAPGVQIADHLVAKFPDEMTIVIQHQFWDLEVHAEHFEIVLKFAGVPQHLSIPYAALTAFQDRGADFGLQFQPQHNGAQAPLTPVGHEETATPDAPAEDNPNKTEEDEPRPTSDGTIVSLDAFRRK